VTSVSLSGKQPWWRRARLFISRHRGLNFAWRLLVLLVGGVVLLAGLVMIIAPGPGWLGIIAGLEILATEFAWPKRLLSVAHRRAKAAKERALDPALRRESLIVAFLVIVLVVVVAYWWVLVFGLPGAITGPLTWLRRTL
jgi:uncharacterized protein (TIGR02611 family)